jgi:hypothetical protein
MRGVDFLSRSACCITVQKLFGGLLKGLSSSCVGWLVSGEQLLDLD